MSNGDAQYTIGCNLQDNCKQPVLVDLPLKDEAGKAIVVGGVPYTPDIVLETGDEAVATIEQVPGNAGFIVAQGDPGAQCVCKVLVPYPDGSTQSVDIAVSIINSEVGQIGVTLGEQIHKA